MRSDDLQSKDRLRWEKQLVRKAVDGDRQAFGQLYHEYAPRIFSRVLMPRLGNRAAAEDALSETFRTALERLHQFKPQGISFYFWLSRIAMNKATDMHRVKARTHRALTNFHELVVPTRPKGDEPGKELEAQQELEQVRARMAVVFDQLNPRYRRAIELRFLEDKSRQECADILEVKVGTFDVLILRALRAFRKKWEE